MFDTIFIDGVDLAARVTCIASLDGLYATPNVRGGNVVIPGIDGEVFVEKSFDPNVIELAVVLSGRTVSDFNQSFRALRRLIPPGKKLALSRRLRIGSTIEDHFASGEYTSGLSPEMQLLRFGRTVIGLRVHEGLWYSTTVFSVGTGTVAINGDVRTHRMTVTMGPGTLTNNTTGHSMTYTGTGTATIDVEQMTAFEGATNTSDKLTWNKSYPFQLAAGSNSITGTATIEYRAAYL